MHTFVIRRYQGETLVPLGFVLERLSHLDVAVWCFRNIKLHVGRPFGLSVEEFERLTAATQTGYCVDGSGMALFRDTGIQIIDGEIALFGKTGELLATIICEDATQWEIRTEFPDTIRELEASGFQSVPD